MNVATPKEVGYPSGILTARRFQKLLVTERQKEILIGSILGDGYIYPAGKIQLEQSVKQTEYLFWKFAELRELAYPGQPQYVNRFDTRTGKQYSSYRFWLRQYFRSWRTIFYLGKVKVFPGKLILTPLMVAVWYMDDGSFSDNSCVISAESFSKQSLEIAQKEFWNQFQIRTIIRSNQKLLIRAKDQKRFGKIIEPFVHPSMQYKIP